MSHACSSRLFDFLADLRPEYRRPGVPWPDAERASADRHRLLTARAGLRQDFRDGRPATSLDRVVSPPLARAITSRISGYPLVRPGSGCPQRRGSPKRAPGTGPDTRFVPGVTGRRFQSGRPGSFSNSAGTSGGPPRDRAAARALLRRAVERGVQLIDTADAYGPGVPEEIIAEALFPLRGPACRDEGRLRWGRLHVWRRRVSAR